MKKMLQIEDSKTGRLLVAMEMSLSSWRLASVREGQPRKRVKTVAGGDYRALLEGVADFKARSSSWRPTLRWCSVMKPGGMGFTRIGG